MGNTVLTVDSLALEGLAVTSIHKKYIPVRLLKRLDIFVFKNFITLFFGTFAISLFVVMMQFLWKYVDDLVGKGLGIDVLAEFFFYAAETLVPMALPLAILLAALISFGNMGERLELLAIKAAGVSLWRTLRPLAILMVLLTAWSYYFQDVVAPAAQKKLMTMLYSIRQASPELDIPEGVFYDGVEGMNLYVREKNKKTGMLYEVIIYNMRDGVSNAHIILADSGKLETNEDKKTLLLHLYSGEQFENLRTNALQTRDVPYRRETFVVKHYIIDFDQNINMDNIDFSSSARTKDTESLKTGIDSLKQEIDSMAHDFYHEMNRGILYVAGVTNLQEGSAEFSQNSSSAKNQKTSSATAARHIDIDTIFARHTPEMQRQIIGQALQKATLAASESEYKAEVMKSYGRDLRMHQIQIWQKLTLALSCIIFFFIAAPLGSIIRKGGLGMPVVIAVIFFIFYYIIDKLGYNLAYAGTIPVWVGLWFSTAVLAPIGIFFTIKANNDSSVFNIDAYINLYKRLWGIRGKRHIVRKEVIINDPDYPQLCVQLQQLADNAHKYRSTKHLTRLPNYFKTFFKPQQDTEIIGIQDQMEYCVDALSNSKNRQVLKLLNVYPIIDPHAHISPFGNTYLNAIAGIVFPLGIILTMRTNRMKRRLRRDLRQIINTSDQLIKIIRSLS